MEDTPKRNRSDSGPGNAGQGGEFPPLSEEDRRFLRIGLRAYGCEETSKWSDLRLYGTWSDATIRLVWRVAYGSLKNRHQDHVDVVERTVGHLWDRRELYDPTAWEWKALVIAISRNKVKTQLKKIARISKVRELGDSLDSGAVRRAASEANVAAELGLLEIRGELAEAFKRLPTEPVNYYCAFLIFVRTLRENVGKAKKRVKKQREVVREGDADGEPGPAGKKVRRRPMSKSESKALARAADSVGMTVPTFKSNARHLLQHIQDRLERDAKLYDGKTDDGTSPNLPPNVITTPQGETAKQGDEEP